MDEEEVIRDGDVIKIPLQNGMYALIDAEDYPKVKDYRWRYHCGYVRAFHAGETIHLSHVILPCPDGFDIDHANRNKLDNRKANLRIATRGQNCANRKSFTNSSSKYKGISWSKKQGRWEAAIRKDKKTFFIGSFDDELAAASAYNEYARKVWGEFALLNDIEEVDWRSMRVLKPPDSQSHYRGVKMHKNGKWTARITIDGKRVTLGYFQNEEDAARAYNEAYEAYTGREGPNLV